MTLQEQAKALGDPTRHRMFRYIADTPELVDVSELTAHFGLNHNAIRQHLAKLLDAGLIVEITAPPTGPGRPRLLYRLNPAGDTRWGAGGPYQPLSLLLLEMLNTDDSAVEVGRRAGQRLQVRIAGDPIERLGDAIARGGFEPKMERRGDQLEFVLQTCPFVDTAVEDPDTVCGLHLGLAMGLADQLDDIVIDGIEPHDPRMAGCRLRFHTVAHGVEAS